MAKYHINAKGEAGKCSATQGNCPFGGEHQHYDSQAKAQVAFELSMAANVLPETTKAVGRKPRDTTEAKKIKPVEENLDHLKTRGWPARGGTYKQSVNFLSLAQLETEKQDLLKVTAMSAEEKAERLAMVNEAVETYYPRKYNGFEKDELFFNHDAVWESYRGPHAGPAWKDASDETVMKQVANIKKHWDNEARTEMAKPYEEDVPIRLIPTGAEVYAPYAKGNPYRKVGTPVDNGPTWDKETNTPTGPHDVVGKYHDGVQWDYVGPSTSFKTGHVPQGKPLAGKWKEANARAASLKEMRVKADQDMVDEILKADGVKK